MGLMTTMQGLRDYMAGANITGIDDDNCVVEDENVFNKILLIDDKVFRRAIIVGYGGLDKAREQQSEFGGSLIHWNINLTLFVLLWDDQVSRTEQIHDAYRTLDQILTAVNTDSTLGGTSMDAVVFQGDPPMMYERQQFNDYIMLSLMIRVKENIYGEF